MRAWRYNENMKKLLLTFIIGGALGVIGGAGGMLIVYPFIFPPPEVNETVSADVAGAFFGETEFREGVAGQDAGHWGRGGVKLYRGDNNKVVVEFQGDFEVGPGPNFWIYLNSRAGIETEDDFNQDKERLKTQKIKSFKGSQIYEIDADKFSEARALTIWCDTFGQYIASADLP